MATQSTRNVTAKKKSNMSDSEKEEKLKKAAEYSKNAKPGSLAAKANLVSRYNGNDGIRKEKTKKEDSDK